MRRIRFTPLCGDSVMRGCDPGWMDGLVAGRDYPRTLREFNTWFGDEEACLDYLARLRWPDGFACPGCGGGRAWRMSKGRNLRCAACRVDVSVTAGTIFAETRLPLTSWFAAAWQVCSQKPGGERARAQARTRARQLRDRVVDIAQAAPGDGAPWTRSAGRRAGGRRELRRSPLGGGETRPAAPPGRQSSRSPSRRCRPVWPAAFASPGSRTSRSRC
jgi:hypothetical protein